eukprot:CAMPEP_0114289604 /NCGR_PEP_ID=MMETSP0059-20121206/7468_1 /TAXON_ID=36894 /ORGANISM="Pyramimonas parkeae, Strain CCMP726" /LENGTH=76 /DNA_ID=CAMNT_0001410899 /DNA_START=873 /DNA_END=1103 /DNA_ORIENTATION=-
MSSSQLRLDSAARGGLAVRRRRSEHRVGVRPEHGVARRRLLEPVLGNPSTIPADAFITLAAVICAYMLHLVRVGGA